MTKTMSIRMDKENFEFVSRLSKPAEMTEMDDTEIVEMTRTPIKNKGS